MSKALSFTHHVISARPRLTLMVLASCLACLAFVRAALVYGPPVPATASAQGALHTLVLPYYSTKADWESTLTLNNAVDAPLNVSITLYSMDGTPLSLPDQSLRPLQNVSVSLREALSALRAAQKFREGSVELSFQNDNGMALGPQLTVAELSRGFSFDMEPAMGLKSNKFEGLWWSLDKETDARVALSNTQGQPLTVHTNVDYRGKQLPYPTIQLSPHETVLLNVDNVRRTLNLQGAGIDKGGLSFTYDGPVGALSAHGFVINRKEGFASNLHFVDPEAQHSSVMEGVGLRLGRSVSRSESSIGFSTPVLWLKNTTSDSQKVTVDVQYTAAGQFTVETLPAITLRAHDVRAVDFSSLLTSPKLQHVDDAGLRVTTAAPRGSIIGELVSISSKGGCLDVPLITVRTNETRSGAHPFTLDADYSSILHLKNFGSKPTTAIVKVLYEGGDYALDLVKLLAGQSISVDLEELRRANKPDIHGHLWPAEITSGQITWVRHGDQPIIGRLVRSSRVNGAGSTFSCGGPCACPPIFHHAEMVPATINGTVGDSIGAFAANEYDYYEACPGFSNIVEGPFAAPATFESADPGVVFVDSAGSSGQLNGPGETQVMATWSTATNNFLDQECGDGNCESNCIPQNGDVSTWAAVHVFARVGKVQYQSGGNFVDIEDTLYVLAGATVTFKAVPDPINASWQNGRPTWTGTAGATGSGETTSATFSTVSSSPTNFKTVVATSGNSITVNVVVISLATQLTPEDNFSGRSLTSFGIHESVALSSSITPTGLTAQQVGGLQWSQNSGSGTLANPPTDGTGSYRVADSAGSAVLQLKMVAGPSMGQGPTNNITVVAPSSGSVQKMPTSGVRHFQNWWSCGFLGDVYVEPKNVSFFNLFFKEEDANAAGSGWLGFLNGISHCDPACTAFRIGSGDIMKGARVVSGGDAIFSGKYRDIERGAYTTGIVTWAIPWDYSISGNAGTFTNFFTVAQTATSVSSGKCTIQKDGSATISAELSDPNSEW